MADRVVHCTRAPFDVYIGRAVPRKGFKASPWANPFKIGPDGDREQVMALYRQWVETSDDQRAQWIREHVGELRGRVLGCWCKEPGRDVPCHGDILVEMADRA